MNIKKCNIEKIKSMVVNNAKELISPYDSYLENHILESNHYEILLDSQQIGYFSIYNKNLLTQFYLIKEYRHLGQEIFNKIRRYEEIQRAYIPTSDEFFLSHGIDCSKGIEIQAYFFQDSMRPIPKDKLLKDFTCRLATENDYEFIKDITGDFFNDLIGQINKKEIYICYVKDKPVSFGVIEHSNIYENLASIGMFTVEGKRLSGVGRNTIVKLKEICYQNKITPIAGCWYYNHNSKKTLESAGMFSQTRLLVIRF